MSRLLRAMLATILATGLLTVAASRPSPQADRSPERMTTERLPALPSPDSAARTEVPQRSPGTSAPDSLSGRLTPSPSPTGKRPAATASPRTSTTLRGTATWYCLPGRSACTVGYPAGGYYAAAGPALRVGNWRGRTVVVELADHSRAVKVTLVDTCACPGGRVIDLFASAFSVLAPLDRGVLPVEVSWP